MKALVALSKKLEAAMKKNVSEWRKSGLLIEDEELDFIINYGIKYRMGLFRQR